MTPLKKHRPASHAGKTAAALLVVVAGFQGLLAAGEPPGVKQRTEARIPVSCLKLSE